MRDPTTELPPPIRDALAEMEAALREFQDAYLAWVRSGPLDDVVRRGLLTQAETRLSRAREALDELERAVARDGEA